MIVSARCRNGDVAYLVDYRLLIGRLRRIADDLWLETEVYSSI